jgi:GNAT superfamily N-acetyltransferase
MSASSVLRVEPATRRDVPEILRMTRGLAEYEKMLHRFTATEEALAESLFGPRPLAEAALAYAEDKPAGMAVFFPTFSTFLARGGVYLEDIFVDPPFRGRGLGKALLAYVAHWAIRHGCGRVDWSVLDWNQPAIGFYRSLGAEPMDDWTVYRLTGDALTRLAAEGLARNS